jgi:hypothetical protein
MKKAAAPAAAFEFARIPPLPRSLSPGVLLGGDANPGSARLHARAAVDKRRGGVLACPAHLSNLCPIAP